METSLQKIIAAIVGVMILFIIPVYIAFEKADDVSYSLAVKLTQNFVDNVRNKGYISPEMYSDFVSGLYATNNTYDVNIEHVKKRYDPAIYIYEKAENEDGTVTKGQLLHILDYDRYKDEYDSGSITIDVGIYNQVNSNIVVKEPSIRLDNGTEEGAILTDKDGNKLDPRQLYKEKIDQYNSQGRIIIDDGEIYADIRKVTGEAFDEDVYIPAIIDDTFKGEIKILNKQGSEPTYLPYAQYRNAYFNSKDGVFWGPTYNKNSINYVPASMRIKGKNMTDKEAEDLYYEKINEYRSEEASGDGRLVFSQGEIYADRDAVSAKKGTFDAKLDKEANITLSEGKITIKKDSIVEGYENDLQNYDEYISTYKNGQDMVVEGEIYTDENADIEDIRAGIWKVGETIDEAKAEALYNSQLDNYNKLGRVIVEKGEVYSTSNSSIGYDSLTDEIRNIEVIGAITVNNPTGWEPTTLDFNNYINEFRENGQIEYIKGGTYEAERIEGTLSYELGNDTFYFDFASNEDKMLDDSDTIEINAVYQNDNIIFGDIKPTVIVTNTATNEVFTKEINTMSEIKQIADNNVVTIDDITYEGNVTIGSNTYNASTESEYIIEISLPQFMILEGKLPSPIYVSEDLTQYVYEYIENGNITRVQTYDKSRLDFQREALEIKENGETKYTLYHDLNKDKYDEYIANATLDTAGNIQEVTIEPIIFTEAELTVEYVQINIEGREPIVITAENMYLINQYYNNQRIVIVAPEVLEKNEINIRHAKLTIYEKGSQKNSIIYEFDGEETSKHEKYDEYVNEYRKDGKITIIPTRVYTADDVEVTPAKITIEVIESNQTLIFDDNHKNYENYLNQFETTGKIKLAEPEVYNIYDDIEVQDPHIQFKDNSGTVIIDIYEKDNAELYDVYKSQYLSKQKISLMYDINDVTGKRANIIIEELDKNDNSTVISTKTIDDSNSNYTRYLREYERTGMITFAGSLIYTKSELKVVNPSITITDPDTGDLIVKYEADFSKLNDDERYNIYELREEEYNEYSQIVNKEITYTNGENCFFEKAHVVNEEIITDKQIVTKLFKDTGVSKVEFLRQCMLGNGDMYNSLVYMNENSYVMNEGDKVNVTVRNKNQTVASVFYSLFTANVGNEEIAKIYVDYGGTIKNDGDAVITEETGMVTSELGRLFKYSGNAEEVTLSPGKYKIECWGAAGGYSDDADTTKVGKGAYATGTFNITQETTLYVYVGGKGSLYSETNTLNGGYNGGGSSYNGYGGGGATDVRLLKGEAEDVSSMLTRIIVAAGGGGNSKTITGYGGSGGNTSNGLNGSPSSSLREGLGASSVKMAVGYADYVDTTEEPAVTKSIPESEYGVFGLGGRVDFDGAGAGGGGYFGGSAAHDENAGGGGGLSYVYTNQKYYDYPLLEKLVLNYGDDILDEIAPYIKEGKWIGIDGTTNVSSLTGNQEMPAGLTFSGSNLMTGNKGNGYAIIKKVD